MSGAINDIRKALAQGQLLVVAGTGITASATRQAKTSTWQGLIKDGIDRCVDLGVRDMAWADRARGDVDSPFEEDLIAAAEKTTQALGGRNGAAYTTWLKNSIGDLKAEDTTLLDALKSLSSAGALIITTNYDGLIEDHLALRPVTWRNPQSLQQALRENGSVVHIHGYWEDPASVVFGSSSYADIIRDESAVAFLRASLYTKTVLFVGFGAGLRDPNFSSIRDWMARSMSGTFFQHYRLVRSSEESIATIEHRNEPITALVYGDHYDELGGFLSSLVAGVTSPPTRSLVTEPGEQRDDEGGVRTSGIPLPGAKSDEKLLAELQTTAEELTRLVGVADSPSDVAANVVGGGELAESLVRFVAIFEEEIREVQIIAQQPESVGPDKILQAVQWGKRLLAIYGAL